MYVKLRTWTGSQQPGSFYIQNKGLHSGRPLRKPIRNCFVVYTDDEMLFEKVYSMFVGRLFEPCIIGSVIPTIRIGDARQVIENAMLTHNDITKELQAIRSIDHFIYNLKNQINLYQELQVAICRRINSVDAASHSSLSSSVTFHKLIVHKQ